MNHRIFTITALVDPGPSDKPKLDSHLFGFYFDRPMATDSVRVNRGSLHEALYDYIVIEEVGEGIQRMSRNEEWFKWDGKSWQPCDKPKSLLHVTNFAMG